MPHRYCADVAANIFLFEGRRRLSLGFDSPNELGAVIALLSPYFWILDDFQVNGFGKGFFLKAVFRFFEALSILCLAFTMSRGSLLSYCIVLLLAIIFRASRQRAKATCISAAMGVRLLLFVFATIWSGASSRGYAAISGDASVLHRIEIWKAALLMIYDRPLHGWGAGSSGYYFAQWYEKPLESFFPGGMVSSYLQIAAEYGLGYLFCCLIFATLPIIYFSKLYRISCDRRFLACLLSSSSFLICNCFSSLWLAPIVMALWWTGVAFGILCTTLQFRILIHSIALAGLASALASTIVWMLGFELDSLAIMKVRSNANLTEIVLMQNCSTKGREALFLADRQVLGSYFGPAIRSVFAKLKTVSSLTVVDRAEYCTFHKDIILVSGEFCSIIPQSHRAAIYLEPRGDVYSTVLVQKPDQIIIPSRDSSEFSARWAKYARDMRIPLSVLRQSGPFVARNGQAVCLVAQVLDQAK